MSSSAALRPKSYRRLTIFVCVAAMIIAAFMGLLAMAPYVMSHKGSRDPLRLLPVVGIGGGAASGLLAGIIWGRVMTRPVKLDRRRKLGRIGAWVGIAVGSLATVLLHTALMIYVSTVGDPWRPENFAIGLVFAIPIGAVLGAICGYALRCKLDAASVDAATMHTAVPPHPPDSPA
jgi:hypothetical protein